jgi:hypothetical protein
MAATPSTTRSTTTPFPAAAVEQVLREAITGLGEDTAAIREPWEPTFDSLALVSVIHVVEPVLPGLKIAPEKVIRRGGYNSVDEAVQHITAGMRRMWERNHR